MKDISLSHTDVIGVFVGIVGIVLACVFYFRSKEQVKPRIRIENTVLVGKSEHLFPESVEVRYNDEVVPVLCKVRITFWNAGRKTLNRSDVAENDPIAIKFSNPEARVLDIRSVTTTRDVTNAKADLKGNHIYLSFDFLDRDDGLALEAFYDSEDAGVVLGGTIKGLREGITWWTHSNYVELPDLGSPGGSLAFGGLPFLLFASYETFSVVSGKGKPDWITVVGAIVAGVLGMILVVRGLYIYFRSRIPRQLRQDSHV